MIENRALREEGRHGINRSRPPLFVFTVKYNKCKK